MLIVIINRASKRCDRKPARISNLIGLSRPRRRQEGVGQRGGGRGLLLLPLPHDVRARHPLRHDDAHQLVRVSAVAYIQYMKIGV